MEPKQLRKVLSILVFFALAGALLSAQPAQATGSKAYNAQIIDGNGPSAYSGMGYGSGEYKREGCGEREDRQSASAEAATMDELTFRTYPTGADKISASSTSGRTLKATLSGAEEVPGPGDPDGSGTALITLSQGQGLVCWELTATDILTATGAHIHVGAFGMSGPVVVALTPPVDGSSSGCTSVDPDLIKDIRQNPEDYYVNIHTTDFPSGALRGQLSK